MTISLNDSNVYTDLQGLQKLRNAAEKNSPEALRAAAQQFEALFIQQLLKGMRAAKLSEGILDSEESEFYLDMSDKQMALDLAKGKGIGLADMIVQQLSQSHGVKEKSIESDKPGSGIDIPTQVNNKIVEGFDNNTIVKKKIQTEQLQADPLLTIDSVDFSTVDRFVKRLWPLAKQAGKELGVDPKIIIAQSALETGWGKHIGRNNQGLSSHNLFNIKANTDWKGDHVVVKTLEYKDGVTNQRFAKFRAYDSFNASFKDYVQLLKGSPRYARALTSAGNSEKFIQELASAGYATDPEYSIKINRIADKLEIQESSSAIKILLNETITKIDGE
jgi:flagellar protein FlgJ